ncbi:hypothetical protein ABZP36_008285 [Zizania latifolia]
MGVLSWLEELVPLIKLRVAAGRIKQQILPEEHWALAYSMLQKVSRSFTLVIQQLDPELHNAPATVAANVRSIFACLLDQVSQYLTEVLDRARESLN